MEAAAPVQPEKVKKDAGRDAPSPAVREEGTTPPPKANAEGAKAEPRSKSGPKTTPPVPDPRNGKKGNAGESKRPALAGGRGTSVDDSGGRTGPVSLRAASKLILYFGFDSTHLTAKSAGDLRDYLARITPVANASFQVNGYTDSVGDFWYNMKLSQRRAEAVRELMIESGIRPASIVAVGKGSAESTAENDLRQHRQDSRKVEVVLTVSR
jgi:outer membrane protein OmpA-like peptidoglycan-associated protein